MSPYEYLQLVKDTAKEQWLDPYQFVMVKMPVVLQGEAKLWWKFHENRMLDWNTFEHLFFEEFASVNFLEKLRRELKIRTQHHNEALTVYIHKITEMHKMANPWVTDKEVIDTVLELMHPEYKSYFRMAQFVSITDLESMAKRVQDSLYSDKTYKPPPALSQSVEPAFAFTDDRYGRQVEFDLSSTSSDKHEEKKIPVSLAALNPQIRRERRRRSTEKKSWKKGRDKRDNRSQSANSNSSKSSTGSGWNNSKSGSGHSESDNGSQKQIFVNNKANFKNDKGKAFYNKSKDNNKNKESNKSEIKKKDGYNKKDFMQGHNKKVFKSENKKTYHKEKHTRAAKVESSDAEESSTEEDEEPQIVNVSKKSNTNKKN